MLTAASSASPGTKPAGNAADRTEPLEKRADGIAVAARGWRRGARGRTRAGPHAELTESGIVPLEIPPRTGAPTERIPAVIHPPTPVQLTPFSVRMLLGFPLEKS